MKKMGHLACFSGGMMALSAKILANDEDLEIAKGITQSCRTSYAKSKTGLGPEAFGPTGSVYRKVSYLTTWNLI